jgi:hypothetical protein
LQDIRQFESRIHFDNCAFSEGAEYIEKEWSIISGSGDRFGKTALAAFGRLLHTVQDFYSHSNWIELHMDTDPIPVWDLKPESLPPGTCSGTWILGIPKCCPGGTPTHQELNKDNPDSQEGSKVVPSGPHKGKSLFDLAYEAAIRASSEQFKRLGKGDLGPAVDRSIAEQSLTQYIDALSTTAAKYDQLRDQMQGE